MSSALDIASIGDSLLPDSIKPIGFDSWEKETWDQYLTRLHIPDDFANRQFYRQVVYDHFDHFNEHYPDFKIENYTIKVLVMTAKEANESIRFFNGEVMDWWAQQYDEFEMKNQDYVVFRSMSQTLTFPFPPILLDPAISKGAGRLTCGRPLHLVEGTHRVSYLRHMLERGTVKPESQHQFILLSPLNMDMEDSE
ncbi:MAG: hypothetical protein QM686_02765 [Herbaspirillum sp.]